MEMPEINRRLKTLIETFKNGNVTQFAKSIGVSQQRLDGLLNLDPKTKKFRSIGDEVLIKVAKQYSHVNLYWLILGIEPMEITTNYDNVLESAFDAMEQNIGRAKNPDVEPGFKEILEAINAGFNSSALVKSIEGVREAVTGLMSVSDKAKDIETFDLTNQKKGRNAAERKSRKRASGS